MKYQEEEYEILYKATDHMMKCRGFQYEMNREFTVDINTVRICNYGFHACVSPKDVHLYHNLFTNSMNRLFKVKGHVVEREKDKVVCDSIIFLEEIDLEEVLAAVGNNQKDHPLYFSLGQLISSSALNSIKEYESLTTEEEKISDILQKFWSAKYLTKNQMSEFIKLIDSLPYYRKYLFFKTFYFNSLYYFLYFQEFRSLYSKVFRAQKIRKNPICGMSYQTWLSRENKKKNK